jgi:uncharacterized protein
MQLDLLLFMKASQLLKMVNHRECPPPGRPWIGYQTWREVIFIHWAVPPENIRSTLPALKDLRLDLFDNKAWLSAVGFIVRYPRLRFLPPLPGMLQFHELNLRTYVTDDSRPGTYFISIRANNLLAVVLNSMAGLPYKSGNIHISGDTHLLEYSDSSEANRIRINWSAGERIATKTPLDIWLTERYYDFQGNGNKLLCYPIHHREWPLQSVILTGKIMLNCGNKILLTENNIACVHYAPGIDALLWTPERVK